MKEHTKNIGIILAPRYNLLVDDFGPEHALEVSCMACGHVGVVTGDRLKKKSPPYMRITFIEAKLRCSSCGVGGVCHWRTVDIRR